MEQAARGLRTGSEVTKEMQPWTPDIDMSTIPDDVLQAEVARRRGTRQRVIRPAVMAWLYQKGRERDAREAAAKAASRRALPRRVM